MKQRIIIFTRKTQTTAISYTIKSHQNTKLGLKKRVHKHNQRILKKNMKKLINKMKKIAKKKLKIRTKRKN